MPKNKPDVLVRADFENLHEAQLFGWFCMAELDSCNHPDHQVYAQAYLSFRNTPREEVIQLLVDQGFNR